MKQEKTFIGRVEEITLVDFSDQIIPAKVDTGADRSSIWASNIVRTQYHLQFTLFDTNSKFYTGTVISLPHDNYSETVVENSFGHKETRYLVYLRIRLAGRLVRASFTLANREAKAYPVLLGSRLLAGKYIVDVSDNSKHSKAIIKERNKRLAKLQKKGTPT